MGEVRGFVWDGWVLCIAGQRGCGPGGVVGSCVATGAVRWRGGGARCASQGAVGQMCPLGGEGGLVLIWNPRRAGEDVRTAVRGAKDGEQRGGKPRGMKGPVKGEKCDREVITTCVQI